MPLRRFDDLNKAYPVCHPHLGGYFRSSIWYRKDLGWVPEDTSGRWGIVRGGKSHFRFPMGGSSGKIGHFRYALAQVFRPAKVLPVFHFQVRWLI